MEDDKPCLQCGDKGFTNAFVYCVRCLNFAVHRYCLPVIPKTFDEFVRWVCDDCEAKVQSQLPVHNHEVSIEIEGFPRNETEKNNLSVVPTQTDERVHKGGHEQSSDDCAKVDSVECGDQLANQMQVEGKNDKHAADERERSQQSSSLQELEEEKVEEDLMRKSKHKLGKRNRMYLTTKRKTMWTHRKRKRERKRNVIESATKKDQHKLGKIKTKDRTPKKKTKTTWTRKKRKRNVIESDTNTDQRKLGKKSSGQSCEERMKVEINGCERLESDSTLLSEVRENNCSDEREKTCISEKLSYSDTDLGSVEHPVISCNGPLRKKRKIIELSKLVSSNDRIENKEPEVKEEKVSASLHSSNICGAYPKELDVVAAEPVVMPIWRGSFSILNKKYDKLDELMAHISNKACQKVYEEATQFQPMLQLEMLPKSKIWPKSFMMSEPSGDNIALYFFPSKISEQDFDHLVDKMMNKELGLKAVVQNAELLIFTSTELPLRYWRFSGKYYLWGVFRGKQNPPSHSHSSEVEVAEIPPIEKRCGDGSPLSPLSNSASGGSTMP